MDMHDIDGPAKRKPKRVCAECLEHMLEAPVIAPSPTAAFASSGGGAGGGDGSIVSNRHIRVARSFSNNGGGGGGGGDAYDDFDDGGGSPSNNATTVPNTLAECVQALRQRLEQWEHGLLVHAHHHADKL